jgi:hypothetical protein
MPAPNTKFKNSSEFLNLVFGGTSICNIDTYNPHINNDTKQNIRTMSFLEPIFYMLKDINEQLEVIEKKN